MLLAIDAGNSFVKLGYHDGHQWQAQQRVVLSDFCQDPLRYLQHPTQQIVIANVAGPRFQTALSAALPNIPMQWVKASAQACGVTSHYDSPEQLGADRWAMLIAARAITQAPCVVVSVGTATTVDLLTATGEFLGGAIAPGVRLMQTALVQGTYGIEPAYGHVKSFPTNTADAKETGLVLALLGVIENMAMGLEKQVQSQVLCILTGGDAHRLAPSLNRPVQVVDNLVLDGLRLLAEKENWL